MRTACWIAAGLAFTAAASAQNIVLNPGFELAAGKLPGTWLPQNAGNGAIAVDEAVHASGLRALRLDAGRRNTRDDRPLGVGQQLRAEHLAGQRVVVSAAMRAAGGAKAELLIFAVAANGKFLATLHLEQQSGGGFATRTGTLALDPATATMIVGCGVHGTSGSAWFDDVTVTPEASSVSVQKTVSPLTATISIHASEVLRTVPRTLFGANMEWIFGGHGVWNPDANHVQPGVAAAAKEMGLGLIRFPGGVLADYYHWKDGVGPERARPSLPYLVMPGTGKNSFGTNELIGFCAAIGAEPLLQVNMVTGSAVEAADWVSFTNNTGRPPAWRVHYWELGNEQYMKHGAPETARSFLKVRDYVARVREYATAMKARDASIRLGLVSGENFGGYRIVEDESWNRTVLKNVAPLVDFIALHNGYAPVVMNQKNLSFADVYGALLAFPLLLERELKNVNRQIQEYAPADAARLKIAITEWGPLFAFGPESEWVGHTKTLGSALFAGSMLQTMFRSDRVDMATFFQLMAVNNFTGWIDQRGNRKATAWAMQMYTKHFGDTLVRSDSAGPSYASKAAGVVDAVDRVPYLDSSASLSADRSTLYLVVVNKHLESAIPSTIHVDGFAARPAARTWVLTAGSVDANNGNDLPDLPGANWARQIKAPHGSLFDVGAPDTVVIRPASSPTNNGAEFHYEFPAASITAIEWKRK